MVRITKEEAKTLRKKIPGAHIRGTANKLYAENSRAVLEALPNNDEAVELLRELNTPAHNNFQHAEG